MADASNVDHLDGTPRVSVGGWDGTYDTKRVSDAHAQHAVNIDD